MNASSIPFSDWEKSTLNEDSNANASKIVFADVVALLDKSPAHRTLAVSELKHLIVPPIRLGQYRLVTHQNKLIAFASWAFLSAEAERAMVLRERKLSVADWHSGKRCWWIDLVSPFGGLTPVTAKIRDFCPYDNALFFRRGKDDGMLRVCEWLKNEKAVRVVCKLSDKVDERAIQYNETVEPILRCHEQYHSKSTEA